MGNRCSCSHKRAKLYHTTHWLTMGLFDTRVTTYDCEDCDETFTREEARRRSLGGTSKCIYASHTLFNKECGHTTFDVDEDTKTERRESCFSGSFWRAFVTSPMKNSDDKQRYPSFWM